MRKSIYFYFCRKAFGFVAQGVKVAAYFVAANYYAHAAVDARGGFAKDADVGVLLTSLFDAAVARRFVGGNGGEDNGAGADCQLLHAGNGQTEYGAEVQLKLVEVLRAGKRHHARVVRAGRKFGEVNAVFVAEEKLNAPNTCAREGSSYFVGHTAGFCQMLGCDVRRLETFAIIAAALHVANGRAE